MRKHIYGAVLAPTFASLLLVGCLSTTQKPAPVAVYGDKNGAGSAGMHTVTEGESLWTISNRYDIVMRDIVFTNNLRAPFLLNTGQRLKLPAPRTHKVRSGDSVSEISRLYEVSEYEIAQLNNLSAPYIVRPGQVLKLPSAMPKPRAVPAAIRTAKIQPPPATSSRLEPKPHGTAIPEPAVVRPKSETPAKVQTASAGSRAKIPSQTPARSSSKFLSPVKGEIISSYGPKKGGLHNDGVNIRAARGSAVKAAENGVVVYAGNELKGSGNLILVRHADRWMTAYAHLDGVSVKRGDVLKRGQVIGTVGSTGSVDSPQLHFEVRRGTEALNPKLYIDS